MGSAVTHRLEARGLLKRFGGRAVVDGANLTVESGEVVGLLGSNGAGKTTVFRMLMGLIEPEGGKVLWDGRDLGRIPSYLRARLGMGYLPQHASAFRGLTVLQNVQAVLALRGAPRAGVRDLLSEFDLAELAQRPAAVLSGGERRRLELCRLAALNPALVILDEPFQGLDRDAVQHLGQLLRRMAADGRWGVIFADHTVTATSGLCDRVQLMVDGQVTPAEMDGTGSVPAYQPEGHSAVDSHWRIEWHSN